ncbi:RNA recognition motif, partial [Trifolium medium]|nr:RNA recognition motif [Trifolium medium]
MRESEVGERGGQRRNRGQQQGYIHRLDREATSFFFSNIPDDVKAVDLWPHFARFGRVGEIFIPDKLDKRGGRFGFVKFRDVRDATELLRRLSNIWIGTFKLRINLSKFERRAAKVQTVEGQNEGDGGKRVQGGRSFKEALAVGEVVGACVGEGTSAQGGQPMTVAAKEVVWEVEVEEERMAGLKGAYVGYLVEEKDVQSIQNNLRMSGFHSLRVTAMGHKQILLWSDKADEVKEVVESVGWWCSLFESVVPWSPELITSHRVTWLRCYGVPIHAWGTDLFRALAFKYGMFIEVDGKTSQFKRCDVIRVKIVTKASKLIDSTMAVKVCDKRFEIRVIEETGGWMELGDGVLKVGPGWHEEQSSKASYDGGESICAVVEGCYSESGSDADVSESCQLLLDEQAHGGVRSVSHGSSREFGYTEGEMSGNIPNLLGYTVESVVNVDRDKCEDLLLEDVGTEHMLEGGPIVPIVDRSGDLGKLGNFQVYEDEAGALVVPGGVNNFNHNYDLMGLSVQAEMDVSADFVNNQLEITGPIPLLTRKEVLCVDGPSLKCNSKFEGVFVAEGPVQVGGSSKQSNGNRKATPTQLPFNKLSKLPRIPHSVPRRKKIIKPMEGGQQGVLDVA